MFFYLWQRQYLDRCDLFFEGERQVLRRDVEFDQSLLPYSLVVNRLKKLIVIEVGDLLFVEGVDESLFDEHGGLGHEVCTFSMRLYCSWNIF